MTVTHTQTFAVRHDECDATQWLHSAVYLRYMQETAIQASTVLGYDQARYEALGRYVISRRTEFEIERPLTYNDTVAVQTAITSVQRVQSVRSYNFTHVPSGRKIARGSTTWVLIDLATGRPAPFTETMLRDYGIQPGEKTAQARFPALPAVPAHAFVARRQVQWQELDAGQHVNNAHYLAYLEDATMQHLIALGWTPARLSAGEIIPAGQHYHLEYHQPAVMGDNLTITTWFELAGESELTQWSMIRRVDDNLLIAQARVRRRWRTGRTWEPARPPAEMLTALMTAQGS